MRTPSLATIATQNGHKKVVELLAASGFKVSPTAKDLENSVWDAHEALRLARLRDADDAEIQAAQKRLEEAERAANH